MTNYRMSKHGTYLLKDNRKLYNWTNESDNVADLLNNLSNENEQLSKECESLTIKKQELELRIIQLEKIIKTGKR